MEFYAFSEKGRRETNEDSFIIEKIDDIYLFSVADGLGGHAFGELASKIAVGELKESFIRKGEQGLLEGFLKTNHTILTENKRRQTDMATTLVACTLNEKTGDCTIAHIGDSRAYIFTDIIWKTKDDSLVQALVDKGVINEAESVQHPQKNIVTKSLGLEKDIQVHIDRKNVKNAIILLCSDGLSDNIKEEEISRIVRTYKPKGACKKLVQKALKNGGSDNITMIIVNSKD
jgi:protein phosphatase